MVTSGELLIQNSYSHTVDFPDLAKTWALNCVFKKKKNSESYCEYSEKSEILHELWKETKAFSKFQPS